MHLIPITLAARIFNGSEAHDLCWNPFSGLCGHGLFYLIKKLTYCNSFQSSQYEHIMVLFTKLLIYSYHEKKSFDTKVPTMQRLYW